eukprot:m.57650 g.57650  ORF g.57650 m.57650 type:complete len:132 (-) comp7093_c0_seq2:279-674(-)
MAVIVLRGPTARSPKKAIRASRLAAQRSSISPRLRQPCSRVFHAGAVVPPGRRNAVFFGGGEYEDDEEDDDEDEVGAEQCEEVTARPRSAAPAGMQLRHAVRAAASAAIAAGALAARQGGSATAREMLTRC